MQGFSEFPGNKKNGLTAIVAPGSTQLHYSRNHPLIRLLTDNFETTLSLDLPAHGVGENKDISPEELIKKFKQKADYIIGYYKLNLRKTVFFGYSLGAMLGIKLLADHSLNSCYIGTGVKITEKKRNIILLYFSNQHFSLPQMASYMREAHGADWKQLPALIRNCFHRNSPLLVNDVDINNINKTDSIFILAERDQSFSHQDAFSNKIPTERVYKVPGDHFNYFSKKVAWKQVSMVIQDYLDKLRVASK